MPIVQNPNTFTNGEGPENIIDAEKFNENFNALFGLVNGQLDSANLSPNAGILLSQLAQAVRAAIPSAGDLKASFRTADHDGWLLCDGRFVAQDDYPNLFAVIGHTANGGTDPRNGTFKLPDYRGRFVLGSSASHALGATGGAESVQLGYAHLPKIAAIGWGAQYATVAAGTDANFRVNGQNDDFGAPHDNMPPYQAANIFIKT